jgi:hypothetical protein
MTDTKTAFDFTTYDPTAMLRKLADGFDVAAAREKVLSDVWQSQKQAIKNVQSLVGSVAEYVPTEAVPFAAELHSAAVANVNFFGTLMATQTDFAVELVKAFSPTATRIVD